MTAQEHTSGQGVGYLVMLKTLIEVAQGEEHTGVIGIFVEDLVVDIHGLVGLVVHEQGIPVHRLVVQVVGVLLGEGSHLFHCLLVLAQTVVEGALRQRETLVLAVVLFQLVQHADGIVVVLHLLVELEEHLEHVLLAFVTLVDPLDDRDGTGVVLSADVGLGKGFHIGGVPGIEFCRLLDTGHRFVLLLQGCVVLAEEVIDLRGIGIQVPTVSQQVEGSIVMAFLPLHHRLEEEVVVFLVYS